MSERKKKAPVVNIGSSMLLVIFLILCLVMFATLSVTTARSNYLLSQREAQRLTDKTAADSASAEILEQLDALLTKAGTDAASASVTAVTSAGDVTVTIQKQADGHLQLSWKIPYSDSQALAVTADLPDTEKPQDYTITRWQTVQTADWTATDTIPVMTP